MIGLKEEFAYFECSSCGCLQIAEIPKDIKKFYPLEYVPFNKARPQNAIGQFLEKKRNYYALFNKGFLGRVIHRRYPSPLLNSMRKAIKNHTSKILDVGSGTGYLLRTLHDFGFKQITGIDPYAKKNAKEKYKILKMTVLELSDTKKFDLVIFNHVFEHIPNQLETLAKISKILTREGVCIIRMPIKTEYIWNLYGTAWVQIDAPRHFFIHTIKSFNQLVHKAGLKIKDVQFDSNELLFLGSEQYMRGISLTAKNSYYVNPNKSIFSAKDIKKFRILAKELNIRQQGDQATFHVCKDIT